MKLFWKLYYKHKLGSNYDTIIGNAKLLRLHTGGAKSGRVSHFYNVNGEQIRGWFRPMNYSLRLTEKHPLESYYAVR